jgi:hypothetical protein
MSREKQPNIGIMVLSLLLVLFFTYVIYGMVSGTGLFVSTDISVIAPEINFQQNTGLVSSDDLESLERGIQENQKLQGLVDSTPVIPVEAGGNAQPFQPFEQGPPVQAPDAIE